VKKVEKEQNNCQKNPLCSSLLDPTDTTTRQLCDACSVRACIVLLSKFSLNHDQQSLLLLVRRRTASEPRATMPRVRMVRDGYWYECMYVCCHVMYVTVYVMLCMSVDDFRLRDLCLLVWGVLKNEQQ